MDIRSRIIVLPLFSQMRVVTTGNLYGIGTTVFLDIDVPQFTKLLPHAEELTFISLTEQPSAQLNWGLFFYSGYTRASELTTSAPFAIGSTLTSIGSKRHSPYTTLTNFLLESRLVVGIGNGSGTNFESASISGTLLVKTAGM